MPTDKKPYTKGYSTGYKRPDDRRKMRVSKARVFIPPSPAGYKARKLHTLIRAYDRMAEWPETAVKIDLKQYFLLLDQYTDATKQVKKEREINGSRMDKAGVDTQGEQSTEENVGGDKSSSVDTGVPAEDPFSG